VLGSSGVHELVCGRRVLTCALLALWYGRLHAFVGRLDWLPASANIGMRKGLCLRARLGLAHHVHAHTHACTCTCTYTHKHVCTHAYMHMHAQTHTHTYTHFVLDRSKSGTKVQTHSHHPWHGFSGTWFLRHMASWACGF